MFTTDVAKVSLTLMTEFYEITFKTIGIGSLRAGQAGSCVVVIETRIAGWTWLTFTRRGQNYCIRSILQTDLRLYPLINDLCLGETDTKVSTHIRRESILDH